MSIHESTILNALQSAAVILDETGDIVYTNTKWDNSVTSLSLSGNESPEKNFFNHCKLAVEEGNDFALRLLFGIRKVLNKSRESFSITIKFSASGPPEWYKTVVSSIQLNSGNHLLIVFNDVSDKNKTIRRLKESEALYRQNFKYSTAGIIFGKNNGEILDVNPATCKILGYSKLELKEGGRSMIVDEDDPAHQEVVRMRNENSVSRGEIEYKHKDGHYIPVQLTSVKYRSDDDEQHIINTFQDLQSEKGNQHTLEEERRFTKTALNSIPGIFFVINSNREFVRWNDSMLADLGYSDEEMIEKSVLDIFDSSEADTICSMMDEAFKNGKTEYFGKIKPKHAGSRNYHLQFNTFESNDKCYLVITGVDITDFVESEKLREQNHQLLTELFDNSPIAKVMINPENEAKKVNRAFIDLFGYPEDELIGNNINSLILNNDLQEEADEICRLAFSGRSDQRTTVRFKKDGTEVPVLLLTVPVRSNGDIIAVYGMYIDLSEQVRLENHLQQSLEEKDILLQEVHHRVKNNLAIIASLLQLQILNDSNEHAKPKLQEAYSRIFSIAKIHESLYKHENMAEISFTDYLTSIVETMPNASRIHIQEEDLPLILNVNQAVPLGLLINEIVNLTPQDDGEQQQAELNCSCEGEDVTITISGLDRQIEDFKSDSEESGFHHLLIETFLQQIHANIEIVRNHKNKFVITFQKSNSVKGSSNSITNHENIIFKKSVA